MTIKQDVNIRGRSRTANADGPHFSQLRVSKQTLNSGVREVMPGVYTPVEPRPDTQPDAARDEGAGGQAALPSI